VSGAEALGYENANLKINTHNLSPIAHSRRSYVDKAI
jgi:hypothetical protein